MELTLDELGLLCGTDKASNGHDYLRHYERLFAPFRDSVRCVLEIGVFWGSSLDMWEMFFPNALVHGIDWNPVCESSAGARKHVHIGRQEDHGFLEKVLALSGPPDIVIDDGGHVGQEQVATFDLLFPVTRMAYAVEDLHVALEGGGGEFLALLGRYVREWAPVGGSGTEAIEVRHNLAVFLKEGCGGG